MTVHPASANVLATLALIVAPGGAVVPFSGSDQSFALDGAGFRCGPTGQNGCG